jgi:hypothetical protein
LGEGWRRDHARGEREPEERKRKRRVSAHGSYRKVENGGVPCNSAEQIARRAFAGREVQFTEERNRR